MRGSLRAAVGFSKVVVESDFGKEALISADPVRSASTWSPLRAVVAPTRVSANFAHHLTAARERGWEVRGLHARVQSAYPCFFLFFFKSMSISCGTAVVTWTGARRRQLRDADETSGNVNLCRKYL